MILAAVAGTAVAAASALAAGPEPDPVSPRTVTVVVQAAPGELRPAPAAADRARALAARLAPGAQLRLVPVTGAADAQGVIQGAAARDGGLVVGAGPVVRAALELARAARPELRTATVPSG
jgi:hypothetical protein